jgi:hypothetical protein
MEKLKRRLSETQKALLTLEEILQEPYSKIIRDACSVAIIFYF